jgi:hypothetical protein
MKHAGICSMVLALLVAGCARQPSAPVSPAPGGKASGWDIRYTAVIALARRGSDRIKDHLDTLADMLDEPQQRANCTSRSAGGQDSVDEALVTGIITGALKAVTELHRRRPEMDLSTLGPAIDKLTESNNPVLRTEAAKTKLALGKS